MKIINFKLEYKPKGFTLVEILVSTAIFSMVMLGMISVFTAAKGRLIHARQRMTSSQLGKFFIDPLQADVRFEDWATGIFAAGKTPETEKINNTDFTATYAITDVSGTSLKRVATTISWTESF